jgi:hypothetical protein
MLANFSSMMIKPNELQCLFLASLSNLGLIIAVKARRNCRGSTEMCSTGVNRLGLAQKY